MRKRSPLGKAQAECDQLMQKIGQRDNPKCLVCGRQCQVMHHFVPKSVSARLRYDWDNLIPLCNGCHMRLHQSGDPEYELTIIEKKGKIWYDKLRKTRLEIIKVNLGYYKEVKERLESLWTI